MSNIDAKTMDGMVLEPISQIMKGDKGDGGGIGKTGPSSYEVWLAAGNTGTVEDYLASIKGDKGDQGNSLNNRGKWVAGIYNPGDYVVAEGRTAKSSLWFLMGDVPVNSTVQPKDANGTWTEAPMEGGGGDVESVNGRTGAVVLTAADLMAIPTAQRGVPNGVATLNGLGQIPNTQVPPLAITNTFVVSSEAAMLALDAEEGDVAIRTDLSRTFIHTNTNLGTMLDWQEMLNPTAPVLSVNGQVGVVNITAADIGIATIQQATDGTDNTQIMTSLRVAQHLYAQTGWGLNSGTNLGALADANTLTVSRINRTTAATLNLPAGVSGEGMMQNYRGTGDQFMQLWSPIRQQSGENFPGVFVRGYYGAAQGWSPWHRMADDANVVKNFGAQDIRGVKTFFDVSRWNLATAGSIEYSNPAAIPGIVGRAGDPAGGVANQYRHDIRFGAGFMQFVVGTSVGATAGAGGFQVDNNFYPIQNAVMALGRNNNRWGNVYTDELTVVGTAESKARSRISLGAVGNVGNEQVAGTKTFTSEIRIQNAAPSFWLDETDGDQAAAGVNLVVDSGRLQLQVRQGGFGAYVRRLFQCSLDGSGIDFSSMIQPMSDSDINNGAAGRRWNNVHALNFNVHNALIFPTANARDTSKRNLGLPITAATTAPTSPQTNDIWIDVSTSPMTMRRWNGTAWVA